MAIENSGHHDHGDYTDDGDQEIAADMEEMIVQTRK
jgi:hypothetical protein